MFQAGLSSLGVVYGDIGTSPLYAINEVFFGHDSHSLPHTPANVLGVISLVLWAITIVISFKYVYYVLRADNEGEGGVFALSGLINKLSRGRARVILTISILLVFAAGLLFGDGIITPAISVTSAVEGISLITKVFTPLVVPITAVILFLLFLVQRKGTAKIGILFGPIIAIWFLAIAVIGVKEIITYPGILAAINPLYAIRELITSPIEKTALIMASVMLTITGGEAMYADMGHFGRKPIRLSWFSVAYPALLLNYLGQGAFLLSNQQVINENLFYSTVPSPFLIPMVILATLATVIASQALISGAFSLASQAIALGYLPRLKIIQTHQEHEGQKYIPSINWLLCFGSILLVVLFGSSARLAGAYGLAVSGVMFVTTLAMMVVARYLWNWSKFKTFAIFLPLALIDLTFLLTNTTKIVEGGYIPLAIGFSLMLIMQIWAWGKAKVRFVYKHYPAITTRELVEIKKKSKHQIPKPMIIMSPEFVSSLDDKIPPLGQMMLDRYGILPRHMVFIKIKVEKEPYVRRNKFEVVKFFDDKKLGSIVSVKVKFGFMEDTNVEDILINLARHKEINIDEHPKNWLIHIRQENVLESPRSTNIFHHFAYVIFNFLLKNSKGSDYYFGLGKNMKLSTEILPVEIE